MVQRIRVSAGIVAVVAVMALVVALPRLVSTSGSSAAVAPQTLSLVCQGQPSCVFGAGTTAIDVDVVLTNNSSSPISIASFNFEVYSGNKAFLTPSTPVPNAPGFNCTTSPPVADTGAYGSGATGSTVPGCINPASPTGDIVIADGSTATLGTVHFAAAGSGSADLMLTNVTVADVDGVSFMECTPDAGPPAAPSGAGLAACTGATVIAGQGGVTSTPAPPTSTPTPVTPTPTPCGEGACRTPVGVPTGAPSAVLLLNSANCITLSIGFGGLDTLSAVADCQTIQNQFSPSPGGLSHFVGCLRGTNFIDFITKTSVHICIPSTDVGQVAPGDFAKIDLDRDQIHYGQDLLVLSFVTADYPVAFETDAGTFISRIGTDLGQTYTCFNSSWEFSPNSGDPDCDGLAETVGDGVVVARLRILAATPRGTHHLAVTQGATSIVKEFHVVGMPASITFTTLASKTSIETGATAPAPPGTDPSPTDCLFRGLTDALTGLPDRPEQAVVIAKALDSDGNEVVGSLLQWDHPFVHVFSFPPRDPLPQGGVALPQVPMIDLGDAGIGFPQVVCGGATPGLLTEDVSVSPSLAPLEDTRIHSVYSIDVVAPSTPTATATSTATSTPTATSTATPTATSAPTQTSRSTATATAQPARRGSGGSQATTTRVPSPVATATSTPVNTVLAIVATPRPRTPGRIVLPDTGRGPSGGDRWVLVLPGVIAGCALLVAAGVRLRRHHTRSG